MERRRFAASDPEQDKHTQRRTPCMRDAHAPGFATVAIGLVLGEQRVEAKELRREFGDAEFCVERLWREVLRLLR